MVDKGKKAERERAFQLENDKTDERRGMSLPLRQETDDLFMD